MSKPKHPTLFAWDRAHPEARAFRTVEGLRAAVIRLRRGPDMDLRPAMLSYAGSEAFAGFTLWCGGEYLASVYLPGEPGLDAAVRALTDPGERGSPRAEAA